MKSHYDLVPEGEYHQEKGVIVWITTHSHLLLLLLCTFVAHVSQYFSMRIAPSPTANNAS